LGQQQFSQGLQANQLQNQYGTQQQQQVQNVLNQGYEDFLAEQRNPYQQVEYMSNLLRGTPSGSVQSMYTAPPSAASQVIGAGTALGGAYLMGGRANGGVVSSYAKGGAVKKKQKSAGLAELALSKI
jgi:Tfp pilus assembly protein PilV